MAGSQPDGLVGDEPLLLFAAIHNRPEFVHSLVKLLSQVCGSRFDPTPPPGSTSVLSYISQVELNGGVADCFIALLDAGAAPTWPATTLPFVDLKGTPEMLSAGSIKAALRRTCWSGNLTVDDIASREMLRRIVRVLAGTRGAWLRVTRAGGPPLASTTCSGVMAAVLGDTRMCLPSDDPANPLRTVSEYTVLVGLFV